MRLRLNFFIAFNLFLFFLSLGAFSQEKNIPEYENILNESQRLHLFVYKDENVENLILNNKKDGEGRVIIISSNDKMRRLFYNDSLQLYYAEFWNIQNKVADSKIEKVIYYFYNNDSSDSSKESNYQTKEINLKNNTFTQCIYDSKNQLIEKNEYDFVIDTEEKSTLNFLPQYKELEIPYRKNNSLFYTYDNAGNITQEKEIHYEYKNQNSLKSYKTNQRKNIYQYSASGVPLTNTFFENNILRMKTVYSSEKDYVQTIYFDEGSFIKIVFKNGKKISETFYSDGKNYE